MLRVNRASKVSEIVCNAQGMTVQRGGKQTIWFGCCLSTTASPGWRERFLFLLLAIARLGTLKPHISNASDYFLGSISK
jgi:hypothetical protein